MKVQNRAITSTSLPAEDTFPEKTQASFENSGWMKASKSRKINLKVKIVFKLSNTWAKENLKKYLA